MPAHFNNWNTILSPTFNTFSVLLFWFSFCYFCVTSNHWKSRHGQSNKGVGRVSFRGCKSDKNVIGSGGLSHFLCTRTKTFVAADRLLASKIPFHCNPQKRRKIPLDLGFGMKINPTRFYPFSVCTHK
jgi:hypothetical protein